MNFRLDLLLTLLTSFYFSSSDAVYSSSWYGGGGGGFHKMYSGDSNAYITKICVRTGSLVDQITVQFSNGNQAGPFGGNGGGYNCYPSSGTLSGSNCITSVNVRSGSLIDGIQFHTKGGSTSSWYGGHGGGFHTVNYNNECLTSLDVRTGSLVDAIQFYFGSGRRSETDPNPDDTVYPEPDGPDPIWGHEDYGYPLDNKPIQVTIPDQYYYAIWALITIILLNCICLTYYLYNKNKKVRKYNKISTIDTEDERL